MPSPAEMILDASLTVTSVPVPSVTVVGSLLSAWTSWKSVVPTACFQPEGSLSCLLSPVVSDELALAWSASEVVLPASPHPDSTRAPMPRAAISPAADPERRRPDVGPCLRPARDPDSDEPTNSVPVVERCGSFS